MSKIQKYNYYLYTASRILIGIDIVRKLRSDIYGLLFYFSIFLIIIINDYLRRDHFYKIANRYYLSIFVSMIISSVLLYNVPGYADLFMFVYLYELILFTEGKRSKLLIALGVFFILFKNIPITVLLSLNFWQESITDLLFFSVGILFYVVMLYAYRNLRKEKIKVDQLHKELALSYEKLQEQSEEIEQLSVSKERNRLAGEIHDNLGHNLVALNMNLDVAHKIMDKDMDKAKELMVKSQSLTKESIEDLRLAVYALRKGSSLSLKKSITKLIDNFQNTGKPKFLIDIDETAETLPTAYKEKLVVSVKESITNSIKHGDPEVITIHIKYEDAKLIVRIKDNGKGCNQLVKGNGLLGIENSIGKIGGKVNYNLKHDKGFEVIFVLEQINIVSPSS